MNPETSPATEKYLQARARIDRVAWLLDNSFRVPGTQRRFGLDPLIGLIPGVGDLLGLALSLYVIVEAARIGAPRKLLLRMLGNAGLEAVVGVVPVLGDAFDFFWKANQRNRDLLVSYIDSQLQPPQKTRFPLAITILIIAFAVLVVLLIFSPPAGGL